MAAQHATSVPAAEATWLVWLALLLGIAGFSLGAIERPSALAPMWGDDSLFWLGILAIAGALCAAAMRFSPRPEAVAILIGCSLLIPAFGVAAFATVVLMLLTAYCIGTSILHWAQQKGFGMASSPADDVFGATVIGLAVCSLLFGFAAHWPINTPISYLALSAIAFGIGWRHLLHLRGVVATASDRTRPNDLPFVLRTILWVAFGVYVYFAALPERYSDALALHLVIPRALEQFGRWHFDAREYAWAVQPMAANWLFGWAYLLGGEYAAKLLNAVFLLLVCGLLIEARIVSRRAGYLAVAMLVLTPLTVIVSASLFVDNALTLFVVAAALYAIRIEEPGSVVFPIGFLVCAAAAIAVKLHGALAIISISTAMLLFGHWRELVRCLWRMKVLWAVFVSAALWPYFYSWYSTDNPLFPYFNELFKSPLFPLENFKNFLYPGGVTARDFVDLTFRSSKYFESHDGAGSFAITLLLPVSLAVVALRGSNRLRLIAFAAVCYTVLMLLNTRYLRYLFPVLPLFMLVLASMLDLVREPYSIRAIMLMGAVGTAIGVGRIPAAGWILSRIELPDAFSARSKEALLDKDVPLRRLGRIQAALGDDHSRVLVFGQSVGADLRGRPVYVSWYYRRLEILVFQKISTEDAANMIAALNATYVIFDNSRSLREWAPWHEATENYGRLIAQSAGSELYEFRPDRVPGIDLLGNGPWQRWEITPAGEPAVSAKDLSLPPATTASRAADTTGLADGARVTLSATIVCETPSTLRAQINWLRPDGSMIRSDADIFPCGGLPDNALIAANMPRGASTAYFYFINDGNANVRLYDERASALPQF